MSLTHAIVSKLKQCLENGFGQVYIEQKKKILNDENPSNSIQKSDLDLFKIEKCHEPIYTKINSLSDLVKIKEDIRVEYKNTIDTFFDLFEKVEDQLDDSVVDSLEIIGKVLQSRNRKIESAFKKFKPEDSWGIVTMQSEFAKLLIKVLKDILESTMPSIHTGIKASNVYDKVVDILNQFYGTLGIYTKEFKVGDSISDQTQYIDIVEMPNEEVKDLHFKDKVSFIESNAYLFDDELVVYEAKVGVWRVS